MTLVKPGSDGGTLTAQQEAFVAAYCACFSATRAAAETGYEGTGPFGKPKIKAAIRRSLTERLGAMDVTADRVLREIARVAFADPSSAVQVQTGDLGGQIVRIVDTDLWPADLHAAVRSIKQDRDGIITIEWRDKMQALQLLAKHLGMEAGKEDGGGVKVFIVPQQAGSEEEWEAQAQEVRQQSQERARVISDQTSG